MAKKRNAGKIRPQEYPDYDDSEFTREYVRERLQDDEDEAPAKPAKRAVDYSLDSRYAEGQVVTISQLQETGTVIQCVGKDLAVLDSKGIIHQLKEKDVYPAQSGS